MMRRAQSQQERQVQILRRAAPCTNLPGTCRSSGHKLVTGVSEFLTPSPPVMLVYHAPKFDQSCLDRDITALADSKGLEPFSNAGTTIYDRHSEHGCHRSCYSRLRQVLQQRTASPAVEQRTCPTFLLYGKPRHRTHSGADLLKLTSLNT